MKTSSIALLLCIFVASTTQAAVLPVARGRISHDLENEKPRVSETGQIELGVALWKPAGSDFSGYQLQNLPRLDLAWVNSLTQSFLFTDTNWNWKAGLGYAGLVNSQTRELVSGFTAKTETPLQWFEGHFGIEAQPEQLTQGRFSVIADAGLLPVVAFMGRSAKDDGRSLAGLGGYLTAGGLYNVGVVGASDCGILATAGYRSIFLGEINSREADLAFGLRVGM